MHYGRKRIQPAGRLVREFHDAARGVLKHALLTLSPEETVAVAAAFADVVRRRNYTCYGCAIMPDHVHVLIRKHRDKAEEMIALLQKESRSAVLAKPQTGRGADHPVWGGPGWKVYLEDRADMARVAQYIRDNRLKIGRPAAVLALRASL